MNSSHTYQQSPAEERHCEPFYSLDFTLKERLLPVCINSPLTIDMFSKNIPFFTILTVMSF